MTKRCPRCGETKSLEDFYARQVGTPFGWCRECEKAAKRARYAARPEVQERTKEQARAYQLANAEHVAAVRKAWEEHNAEPLVERLAG